MYGSPPASSKDLNLPFPPPAGHFSHRKEESDHLRHHPHHHHHQQQQQQMSSGLLRYRSAPSSLFGEACEDFLPVRPSSPETETMFARFLAPDLRNEIREKPAGGGVQGSPQFAPPGSAAVEHRGAGEVSAQRDGGFSAPQMLYHSQQQQQQQQIPSHSSLDSPYRVVGSMEAEQMKGGGGGGSGGNCSNLIRHSSSPAGLFAHLNVENGYAPMRGIGGFRNGNGSLGEAGMPASRLKGQLSFSSRQTSSAALMSQISEMGSDGLGGSSPEDSSLGSGNAGRCFIPGFPIASWDDPPLPSDRFSGLKRGRDVDGKLVTGLNQSEPQIGELRNSASGLSSSDMTNIEKFLQFQDSVPCKIRAKRGCATHPRSIAERVRRTRISERMRKLQELVPNMDKQTNTADMLELAVDYIKDLQRQVKGLSDSRASCTCSSSKQKPYSNPAA